MSDSTPPQHLPPLGVGRIVSDAFSLYFRNIVLLTAVPFLPMLAFQLLSFALVPMDLATQQPAGDPSMLGIVVLMGLSLLVYAVVGGSVMLAAYARGSAGRPTSGPMSR
ncbi:hypothetical protein [Methylobrevis pamukkalensis]|uniref:Uncharacterized protein n=1 Tax=Methylobrevis pamukkalensis TaxID=1439726 RepID=A0A1E3GZI5_9HYPH|nr:hypothetical protein [Methylobrevis pamukkalensis]ODN69470.1 hypothetical protein A6302_03237 [Methylobrevis pamukkalensis]